MEHFVDLKQKEVINVLDGRRMGCVYDLLLNLHEGRIEAIVVPGCGKVSAFFRGGEDIIIPWCKVIKIGNDVILCEMAPFAERI